MSLDFFYTNITYILWRDSSDMPVFDPFSLYSSNVPLDWCRDYDSHSVQHSEWPRLWELPASTSKDKHMLSDVLPTRVARSHLLRPLTRSRPYSK